jgi:hypothetical protein
MRKRMPHLTTIAAIGFCVAILSIALASNASAQARPVIVNVENFVRAETAAQFDRIVEMAGAVGQTDRHPHES